MAKDLVTTAGPEPEDKALSESSKPQHARLNLEFVSELTKKNGFVESSPDHTADRRIRHLDAEFKPNCPAGLYIASLGTDASRATMTRILHYLAKGAGWKSATEAPWAHIDYAHANQLLRLLESKKLAKKTFQLYASALRGVAKQAFATGQMPVDIYQRLRLIKPPAGSDSVAPHKALSDSEIASVFTKCKEDSSIRGKRDLAVLGLLYHAGLRRAEIGMIDYLDYEPKSNRGLSYVDFGASLLYVMGKGQKQRVVTLNATVMDYIGEYMDVRSELPGPLIQRIRGHHAGNYRLTDEARVTGSGVYDIVEYRCVHLPKHFSPHDFRHTFGTNMIAKGHALTTVQELLGHNDIKTTAGYIATDDNQRKRATDDLADEGKK